MFSFRAVTQLHFIVLLWDINLSFIWQCEQNKKACDCYNNQKSDEGIMLGFHYQP